MAEWDDSRIRAWLQEGNARLHERLQQALDDSRSEASLHAFLRTSRLPESVCAHIASKHTAGKPSVDPPAFRSALRETLKLRPIAQRALRQFEALKPGHGQCVPSEPLRRQLSANSKLSDSVRSDAMHHLSQSDHLHWDAFFSVMCLLTTGQPSPPQQSQQSHPQQKRESSSSYSNGFAEDVVSNPFAENASPPSSPRSSSAPQRSSSSNTNANSFALTPSPFDDDGAPEARKDSADTFSVAAASAGSRYGDEEELRAIRGELKKLHGRALVLRQDRGQGRSKPEIESLSEEVSTLESKIEDLCTSFESDIATEKARLKQEEERLQKRKQELSEERKAKEQSLESRNHELQALRNEVAQADEEVRKEREEGVDPLERRLTEAAEERKLLENLKVEHKEEASSLCEKKAGLKAKAEFIEQDVESSKARASELEQEVESHKQENTRLEQELESKQRDREEAQQRLARATEQEKQTHERMQQFREDVYTAEQEVWDIQSKAKIVANRSSEVQSTCAELQAALDDSEQRLARSVVECALSNAMLRVSEREESAAEDSLEEVHSELADSQRAQMQSAQQLRWLDVRSNSLQERIDMMREEVAENDELARQYQEESLARAEDISHLESECERLNQQRDQLAQECVDAAADKAYEEHRKASVEAHLNALTRRVESLSSANAEARKYAHAAQQSSAEEEFTYKHRQLAESSFPPLSPRVDPPERGFAALPGMSAMHEKTSRRRAQRGADAEYAYSESEEHLHPASWKQKLEGNVDRLVTKGSRSKFVHTAGDDDQEGGNSEVADFAEYYFAVATSGDDNDPFAAEAAGKNINAAESNHTSASAHVFEDFGSDAFDVAFADDVEDGFHQQSQTKP